MTIVTKTAAKITLSEGQSVKIGTKSYTMADAIAQVMARYDELYLLQEQALSCHKFIGDFLLAAKSLYPSTKEFGAFIASTDLAAMSKQDRADSMFVATNWTKVQKMNKNGTLDQLGVSAIRKRIQAAEKPKASTGSAGNVSKGKKQADKAQELPKAQFNSVEELAQFVLTACETHGFHPNDFAKAYSKARAKA